MVHAGARIAAWLTVVALTLGLAVAGLARPQHGELAATAALLTIEGPIGPATSAYFRKARDRALESGARLIVLRIDTPGGLDEAMRDIVKDILASPVPIVGFVAPGGARAASAGTYILYATHVAAMAPATNLGSATPVPIAGGEEPKQPPRVPTSDPAAEDRPKSAPPDRAEAVRNKVVNDAAAYLRGLAERRGRNADWAEAAVREGANVTASAALELKVIDLIADDITDLLAKSDGREVDTVNGRVTLESDGLVVEAFDPDWRFEMLSILASPTTAYLLLLVGVYGLLLEGYNPGAIVPGVVGAIALLLGLFALQILPVNYVGLALMALGVALLIAESLVPSFGALGFGGIVAFVFGSVMLMDTDVPGYGVNLGVIAGVAVGASVLMGLTVYLLVRSRRKPVVTGDAVLLGRLARVTEFEHGQGWAVLGGERWKIRSTAALGAGISARVIAVEGLVLVVEPLEPP